VLKTILKYGAVIIVFEVAVVNIAGTTSLLGSSSSALGGLFSTVRGTSVKAA
jgi:hypothetical protein